jgi:hypothetical protein
MEQKQPNSDGLALDAILLDDFNSVDENNYNRESNFFCFWLG